MKLSEMRHNLSIGERFSSLGGGRELQAGDALVIVDVQNDYLPGGHLAVPHGDEVIPPLNRYLAEFARCKLPVFVTCDWHPKNHCSFDTQGGPWPVHCVQYTDGAELARELALPDWTIKLCKPGLADRETFSAFEGTGLEQQLRSRGVTTLFIGGLATDYSVLHTVLGALGCGFSVFLLRDAIRAVNMRPEDGDAAIQEMCSSGAVVLEFDLILR
jgi:nicotinamidase/pyrazinamidase